MHAHRRGFDLTALTRPQADVLEPALHACTFPTGRIVNRSGATVPVAVSDLSRFSEALDVNGHGHAHEAGEHAHLLGEPVHAQASIVTGRRAPLGLYWLPTHAYPAGRIEVGAAAMASPDLAREVLLAEAAHAVDLATMSDSQRARIMLLFDWIGAGEQPTGWFDELEGEENYWAWRGERWMGAWAAAFCPSLPRPLEARQPWQWSYDAADLKRIRSILRRPSS
jgi:hypothetical protein